MSKYVKVGCKKYPDPEGGEPLVVNQWARTGEDINAEFLKLLYVGILRWREDFTDTSFQASFRTFIEIMLKIKYGDQDVTIDPHEIKEKLGVSEVTARTHLKILEKKGYITKKAKRRGCHTYTVDKYIVNKR